MKTYIKKILPSELKDINFWLLSAVALVPIFYICFNQKVTHMTFNFIILLFVAYLYLLKLIGKIKRKEKIELPKNKALFILFVMTIWIFVGSFFAYNQQAAWLGLYKNMVGEVSVWQYIFYFVVALLAVNVKKENIKHLLYEFLVVALIIMTIQFVKQDYHYAFVHKNSAGYYFCTTFALSVGLLLFSKNIKEILFLIVAILMHVVSLTLNSSVGPIIGIIAFLFFCLVYFAIYNRKIFLRMLGLCLVCVSIFAIFDYIPNLNKFKTEPTSIAVQLRDIGLVALNKVGIISDMDYQEIIISNGGLTPGADGWDRLEMWQRCIENMKERPIFGVGAGSWWSYNPDMPVSCPHNEFLCYGSYFGLPVLLLYVSCILYLFIKFRIKHKKLNNLAFVLGGAILSYLVSSIFGNVFPFTAPLFYILLGFLIKFVDNKGDHDFGKNQFEEVKLNEEDKNL